MTSQITSLAPPRVGFRNVQTISDLAPRDCWILIVDGLEILSPREPVVTEKHVRETFSGSSSEKTLAALVERARTSTGIPEDCVPTASHSGPAGGGLIDVDWRWWVTSC